MKAPGVARSGWWMTATSVTRRLLFAVTPLAQPDGLFFRPLSQGIDSALYIWIVCDARSPSLGSRVMSAHSSDSTRNVRETVPDLRRRLGLFSFQDDASKAESALKSGRCPDLGLRPGGIVEWLAVTPGAGA